jgi:hypothetical protein
VVFDPGEYELGVHRLDHRGQLVDVSGLLGESTGEDDLGLLVDDGLSAFCRVPRNAAIVPREMRTT